MENNEKKPSSLYTVKVLLTAFLMTGLAIYSYKYLPQKELLLIPGDDLISYYVDTTGTSHFSWLDQDKHKFRCTYDNAPSNYKYCGLDLRQGDGLVSGVDWSGFDEVDLEINYTGKAEVMRLFVRNFSPEFSKLKDARTTAKYINTMVPVSELNGHLILDFEEFAMPEWWVLSSGIPRELTYPEFSNVVHVGIDIPFPAPYGDHDLELKSMRLIGLYFSKDGWYLAVLGIWGVMLFVIAIRRELYLRRKAQVSTQNLVKEKVKSEHLKQVSEKYKELAILDTLTGVFNRRGIYQFYEHTFDENPDEKGSIIMLDIDHFKNINDTYGHDVGDNVIQAIGKILRNCVRDEDSVGRWGGEEFIILCINTKLDGATNLVEKIRTEVEAHVFDDIPDSTITVSLGVGLIQQEKGFDENVRYTDIAMYKAKQSGRNCWVTVD